MTDILQKCVAIQLEEGKQLPVSQSYTSSPQSSVLYYDILYYVILGKQNWNNRSVSEVAFFISHEAGRHFVLNFGIYCSFHFDEAGIFKFFCFILKLLIR